jgi:hypothetical protein
LSMARSCFRKFSSVLVASAAGVLRWPNIPLGPKRDPGAAERLPDAPFDAADGPGVNRQPHHVHCVEQTADTAQKHGLCWQCTACQHTKQVCRALEQYSDIPVITWLQASQNVFVHPRTAAQQAVLCSRLPSRMHVVLCFNSFSNAFRH